MKKCDRLLSFRVLSTGLLCSAWMTGTDAGETEGAGVVEDATTVGDCSREELAMV